MTQEYKIISGTDSEVTEEINIHLQQGWKLHGNLCATTIIGSQATIQYSQAMVREVDQRTPWG